jgi:hypothetical protein
VNPLRRWLGLGPDERRELLRAGLAVPVIRLGLSTLPFDTLNNTLDKTLDALVSWLGREGAGGERPADDAAEVERVRWAVAAVGRRLPGATCLTQALAARMLLGRKGIPARVRIGVRRDEAGRIAGHAWLESGAEDGGKDHGCRGEEAEGYLTLSPASGDAKARR